mmetsp:Transcript_11920/g.48047  ORF Transcript_11920/g.48047 Transcript_11920/m.48047 type:complete len:277 (+) Transcript_11920:210-1040(+)
MWCVPQKKKKGRVFGGGSSVISRSRSVVVVRGLVTRHTTASQLLLLLDRRRPRGGRIIGIRLVADEVERQDVRLEDAACIINKLEAASDRAARRVELGARDVLEVMPHSEARRLPDDARRALGHHDRAAVGVGDDPVPRPQLHDRGRRDVGDAHSVREHARLRRRVDAEVLGRGLHAHAVHLAGRRDAQRGEQLVERAERAERLVRRGRLGGGALVGCTSLCVRVGAARAALLGRLAISSAHEAQEGVGLDDAEAGRVGGRGPREHGGALGIELAL